MVVFPAEATGLSGGRQSAERSSVDTTRAPHNVKPFVYGGFQIMVRLLIFAALFVLVRCESDCGKALMNGTEVEYFPWHAALYKRNTVTQEYLYVCGAALISPKILISAAHCFNELKLNTPDALSPKKRFSVALGKVYKDWNAKENNTIHKSRVSKVSVPETFLSVLHHLESDVAVLELETPAPEARNIGPICLDEKAYLTEGQNVQIAGWGLGARPQNANNQEIVAHTNLPSLLYRECRRRAPVSVSMFVTRDKFCSFLAMVATRGLDGGDSGSAVMAEHGGAWYLHGVVSSRDTADNHYVFTNVTFPQHLQWIRTVRSEWEAEQR